MQQNLETFLSSAREQGRVVPRFVERELRAFLDCGLLRRGFLRVRCGACGQERLVAFSCKKRGFCPSCGARRMSARKLYSEAALPPLPAAHLVDRVFPEVPLRQYALSLPFALRTRLAFDQALCSEVLRIFMQSGFSSLRRRARKTLTASWLHCGSVCFLQRAGGAINLNPHHHALVLDGVYFSRLPHEAPRFTPLPPPSDEEVTRITATIARRVEGLLKRKGLLGEQAATDPDPLETEESLLLQLYSASVQGRIASGPRTGQRGLRLGDRVDVDETQVIAGPRCASLQGVSLHADVCVPARDRRRLKRLQPDCDRFGPRTLALQRDGDRLGLFAEDTFSHQARCVRNSRETSKSPLPRTCVRPLIRRIRYGDFGFAPKRPKGGRAMKWRQSAKSAEQGRRTRNCTTSLARRLAIGLTLAGLLTPALASGEDYEAWVYTQLPAAPEGICVDSKGNLFATMIGTNEVVRLKSDGTYEHIAWVPEEGAGGLTIGIEADEQDNLYVAFKWHDESFQLSDPRHPDCMDINDTTTGVYKINAQTHEVAPVATRGDGWKMCFPDDVDIDDEGNIYMSDLTYAGIWKITPDGKAGVWCDHQLLNWEHWYPTPLGINVLVLDNEQENIYFATSSGSTSLVGKVPVREDGTAGEPVIVSRGHASFDGIEIDKEGYLYLSELSNDEIVVIDPLSANPLGADLPPRLHIANKATAPLDGPCSLALRDGILYSTQLGYGNPDPDKTIVAIRGFLKPTWGRKE